MSVLKRRSRMISFRVSEAEYDGLKTLCASEGARSVSDMARDAVHRLVSNHSGPANHVEMVVQLLQHRIEALDQEVRRLSRALDGQPAYQPAEVRNGNADQ